MIAGTNLTYTVRLLIRINVCVLRRWKIIDFCVILHVLQEESQDDGVETVGHGVLRNSGTLQI